MRADSGIYLLVLHLRRARLIDIGRLGRVRFPAGLYIYVGSARRGLQARLRRHRRLRKVFRWHIDYLRRHARVLAVSAGPWARGRECAVAQVVLTIPGAAVVARGFGSSDCRCAAHLVHLITPLRLRGICRCTGYQFIVDAVLAAGGMLRQAGVGP